MSHEDLPPAVEEQIRLRVDRLLGRSFSSQAERRAVAREWRAHLAESWQELRGVGHEPDEALELAFSRFGDVVELRLPMARLQWRRDLSWSVLGVPKAVWLWVAVEIAAMQLLWPASRPPAAVWGLVLVSTAGVVTALVLLLRLALARLRRGAGGSRRWSGFVVTGVAAWGLVAALRWVVATAQPGGPVASASPWAAAVIALFLASLPILWQWIEQTTAPSAGVE